MENIFITKLTLEKVRNLDYVEIPLAKDKKKHLIFTGKNGSGKTTILNSLSEYFDVITTTNRLPLVKSQLSIAKNNYTPSSCHLLLCKIYLFLVF